MPRSSRRSSRSPLSSIHSLPHQLPREGHMIFLLDSMPKHGDSSATTCDTLMPDSSLYRKR